MVKKYYVVDFMLREKKSDNLKTNKDVQVIKLSDLKKEIEKFQLKIIGEDNPDKNIDSQMVKRYKLIFEFETSEDREEFDKFITKLRMNHKGYLTSPCKKPFFHYWSDD